MNVNDNIRMNNMNNQNNGGMNFQMGNQQGRDEINDAFDNLF